MFLADFHVHTDRSDGKLPLKTVIDLYGERGFGAIAITDHLCEPASILGKASRYLGYSLTETNFSEYMSELAEAARDAWKRYRMVVIPGYEITKNHVSNHRSAHMLALGLDRYVDPRLDFPELCQAVRSLGGLSVAAHPVSTRKWEKQTYQLWNRRHELKDCFDAWEVASGPHLFPEVLHSGYPMIANSDLHVAKQMSSWKNVLRCERHPEAILDAIRKQEVQFRFYQDPLADGIAASPLAQVGRVGRMA